MENDVPPIRPAPGLLVPWTKILRNLSTASTTCANIYKPAYTFFLCGLWLVFKSKAELSKEPPYFLKAWLVSFLIFFYLFYD